VGFLGYVFERLNPEGIPMRIKRQSREDHEDELLTAVIANLVTSAEESDNDELAEEIATWLVYGIPDSAVEEIYRRAGVSINGLN
jgi:hypothetical protein